MLVPLINTVNIAILIFFIALAGLYTFLLFGSLPTIIDYFNISSSTNIENILKSSEEPPVTIIIPMYNEKLLVKDTLLSALNTTYRNVQIILVNDGSTDNTLELITKEFQLEETPFIIEPKIETQKVKHIYVSTIHKNLIVIDKENGGAGDALNVGLNACITPYVFTLDADSIIDPHAVSYLMYEVLTKPNTIAAGGGVYILNGCTVKDGKIEKAALPKNYTAAVQSCEYLRSHIFNRTGWNKFGGTMSYSGTATLFKHQALIEAGGFDNDNYAQDSEIIMRLHKTSHRNKAPYSISFTPAAVVWTDVPDTLKSFAIQRDKWRRGLLRSVFSNMSLFFNPKCKIQGLFGFPAYFIFEILAPYVEFTAYLMLGLGYYFGIVSGTTAILFIILAWGFASYITVGNTFASIITFNQYKRISDILWMLLLAALEMFGFRQFNVLVNIYGTFHYAVNRLRGKPQ